MGGIPTGNERVFRGWEEHLTILWMGKDRDAVKGIMDRMMVEDIGELNLGSDHNLILYEVRIRGWEERMSAPHLNGRWMIR